MAIVAQYHGPKQDAGSEQAFRDTVPRFLQRYSVQLEFNKRRIDQYHFLHVRRSSFTNEIRVCRRQQRHVGQHL
jgi:hypothetical protein